jgi:hypothetical protein
MPSRARKGADFFLLVVGTIPSEGEQTAPWMTATYLFIERLAVATSSNLTSL